MAQTKTSCTEEVQIQWKIESMYKESAKFESCVEKTLNANLVKSVLHLREIC